MTDDPDTASRRLAADALARGEATAWFEELYDAAGRGEAVVPWDRGEAHPLVAEWLADHPGEGRRALVVGCGPGYDAELAARLGYAVTAFDVSPTAIARTRESHPGSTVDYLVADLLDPPAAWRSTFDLVIECITVQALPVPLQAPATQSVSSFVAPGGTLLVVSGARSADDEPDGPPWPLTRAGIEAFATGDLRMTSLEHLPSPIVPGAHRWRAVFQRPALR